MSKTSRVAELAVKLSYRVGDCIEGGTPSPFHVPGPGRLAADAAALVRLAERVTACDVIECNGGAVDGDDTAARRAQSGVEANPDYVAVLWREFDARRGARVAAADKRRARAIAKAASVAAGYGLSVWHQPDPRGASLYLYDPAKHGTPDARWDQHAPGIVCI